MLIALVVLAAVAGTIAAVVAIDRSDSDSLRAKLGVYDAVFVVARDGAKLIQLTHDRRFHDYAWSPDGRRIAAVTSSMDGHGADVQGPLELLQPSTKTARAVRLGGIGSNVVWRSNQSTQLLSTSSHGKIADTRLIHVDADGTVRRAASVGPIGAAAWASRGGSLAIVACARTRAPLGLEVLSAAGRLRRDLGRLPGSIGAGVCEDPLAAADEDLGWAPDGRALFLTTSSGLWEYSPSGASRRRIDSDVVARSAPAVSPDGRRLVIEAQASAPDAGVRLYLLQASGGPARLLVTSAASHPAWSPDGRLIAFVGPAGETVETVPADGGTPTELTRLPGAQIRSLSWSPAGGELAFTAAARPPEG